MQNVRGRVGVLGRRHMRVRFNMDANAESTIQAQKQPESPARDELLKRLIGEFVYFLISLQTNFIFRNNK